jgi:hypothetical protein
LSVDEAALLRLGLFAANLLATESAMAQMAPVPGAASAFGAAQNAVKVSFRVNGAPYTLELDSRVVLPDALRERLAGMVGIPAAIANAVFHATGKRVRSLPITPDKLL